MTAAEIIEVTDAQAITAASLADANAARDGRAITSVSIAPSLNSRPNIQLTTKPTASNVAIDVT